MRLQRNRHSHALLARVYISKPFWKEVWQYLTKLHTHLSFYPVIPLLGVYPEGIPSPTENTCAQLGKTEYRNTEYNQSTHI
jgi:hypothetical protein